MMVKPKVSIVNIVVTCDLGMRLDLKKVARLSGFYYDPHIYRGRAAYFQDHKTKGKIILFNSGKLISVGVKSEDEAIHDLKYVTKLLIKANIVENDFTNHKISNIVAVADIGKPIDIEALASRVKGAIYEPEQFPGVIIKLYTPEKATLLFFSSGKIIITGLKSRESIEEAANRILSLLNSLKKDK